MNTLTDRNKILIGVFAFAIVLGIFLLVRFSASDQDEMTADRIVETAEPEVLPPPDPEQRARVAALMETWPASPDFHDGFYALAPALSNAPGGVTSIKFDPQDEYWGLPRDPGFEEIEAYCSACHSLEIVMQQQLPPDRWAELLTWMQEKQGMAELDPEDYILVLNYLQTHFGSQVVGQP